MDSNFVEDRRGAWEDETDVNAEVGVAVQEAPQASPDVLIVARSVDERERELSAF